MSLMQKFSIFRKIIEKYFFLCYSDYKQKQHLIIRIYVL